MAGDEVEMEGMMPDPMRKFDGEFCGVRWKIGRGPEADGEAVELFEQLVQLRNGQAGPG
jgi:hypothetical protein